MHQSLAVFMGAAFLFVASEALADCAAGEVLFEDQFEDNLSGWADRADEKLENGQFIVSPESGKGVKNYLTTFQFNNKKLCIEADIESQIKNGGHAGLLFWAKDFKNFYEFIIGKNKKSELENTLYREIDGETLLIFGTESKDADTKPVFDIGPGITNKVQVEIDNQTVSFSVNGTLIKKLRAQRPKNALLIGLYAQNAEGKEGEAEAHVFHSFKVTDPEG